LGQYAVNLILPVNYAFSINYKLNPLTFHPGYRIGQGEVAGEFDHLWHPFHRVQWNNHARREFRREAVVPASQELLALIICNASHAVQKGNVIFGHDLFLLWLL